MQKPKPLIQSASMGSLLAYAAIRYRFGVVHAVVNRLDRAQISKDGPEVLVAHMTKEPPRHDRIELACAHLATVDDFQKEPFVVIADPRRIGRDIRAGRLPVWIGLYQISTSELEAGYRLAAALVPQRVAPLAGADLHQVCTSLRRRRNVRHRNRRSDRGGKRRDDVVRSLRCRQRISDCRNRAQISND